MYKHANLPWRDNFSLFTPVSPSPFETVIPAAALMALAEHIQSLSHREREQQIAELHRRWYASRTTLPMVPQDTHRLALIKVEKEQITSNPVREISTHQYGVLGGSRDLLRLSH